MKAARQALNGHFTIKVVIANNDFLNFHFKKLLMPDFHRFISEHPPFIPVQYEWILILSHSICLPGSFYFWVQLLAFVQNNKFSKPKRDTVDKYYEENAFLALCSKLGSITNSAEYHVIKTHSPVVQNNSPNPQFATFRCSVEILYVTQFLPVFCQNLSKNNRFSF